MLSVVQYFERKISLLRTFCYENWSPLQSLAMLPGIPHVLLEYFHLNQCSWGLFLKQKLWIAEFVLSSLPSFSKSFQKEQKAQQVPFWQVILNWERPQRCDLSPRAKRMTVNPNGVADSGCWTVQSPPPLLCDHEHLRWAGIASLE